MGHVFPIDEAIRRAAYCGDKEILGKARSILEGRDQRDEPSRSAMRTRGRLRAECAVEGDRAGVPDCGRALERVGPFPATTSTNAGDSTRCGIDTSIRRASRRTRSRNGPLMPRCYA